MQPEDKQQRIETLYGHVVQLSAPERAAFLDEACANDPPEIRAEVEKLLAINKQARKDSGFLGEPQLKGVAAEIERVVMDAHSQNSSAAHADAKPQSPEADRNLLFGIVALQLDFVTRDQLIAGMHAWVLCKQRRLGDILVEHGALNADDRSMLEAMVDRHVQLHDDNPEKSLAGLNSSDSVRDKLQSLTDDDVKGSLASVPAARDDDPDRTADWSRRGQTSYDGRFRILRPYARGSFGEVFVAFDCELDREVALKKLDVAHHDVTTIRRRFLDEARITASLEHPGIVPIYGIGVDEHNHPHYAMRLVAGRTLGDAIDEFHRGGHDALSFDRRLWHHGVKTDTAPL